MELLLLVVALATLTAGQTVPKNIETVYKTGKEYIYQYESHILSGLPLGSNIYSGIKIKGQIVLQKVTYIQMKMELRSPRLYKVNGPILMHDPTREMIPDAVMIELLDSDTENMKTFLVKSVMFNYERGHVEDLVTEKDDPDWSVNIKKGALSLLEVNFNDRHSLSPLVDVASSEILPKLYRVVEPSVSGECETTYKLKTDRSMDGVPTMNLVKVRDLSRCIDKVIISKSMMNYSPCEQGTEILSAQSSVRYNFLGAPGQYIILNAVGESQYNMAPYKEVLGKITTLANQTLTLVDSRPITVQIREPNPPKPQDLPLTARLPHGPSSVPQDQQEIVKMVKKVLTGVDQLMEDNVEEEVTDLLKELHRLLEKLDKISLRRIVSEMDKSPTKLPRARKSFLDMLPAVGTLAAVDVVLERIEKKVESAQSAAISLMTIGLHPKPDIPVVKRIMESVAKLDKMEPFVRRSAWLCLSALGHKLMERNNTEVTETLSQKKVLRLLRSESNEVGLRRKLYERLNDVKTDLKEMLKLYKTTQEDIVQMVKDLYMKGDENSVLLALKVMGGLKYMDFLTKLKSIAMDKDSSVVFRLEAIISMKELAKIQPDKIQKILLPLFFDRSEEEEVRSLAVLVSMMTDLPRPELEMVVMSMVDEPSDHVTSLVASTLTELSNTSLPGNCLRSLSQNCTEAMRLIQKRMLGLYRSNMIQRSTYSRELQMGQFYEQVMLYSSKEKLPRAMAMQLTHYSKKSSVIVFQAGYKAKGLDGVLDKILDDPNLGGMSEMVRKLLHPRHKRSVSQTEQEIKDIKQKLEVKPRKPEPLEGHIFIKMNGQELIFFDLQELMPQTSPKSPVKHASLLDSLEGNFNVLPDISGMLKILQKLLNSQKSLVLPVSRSSLPTETGLPLHLNSKMAIALRFDGDVQIKPDPNSAKKRSFLSKFDSIMTMKFRGVVDHSMDMVAELKSLYSGLSCKSKVSMSLPASMTVNVDPENDKMLVKITDQKKYEPLKIEMKPVAMIRRLPEDAAHYPSPVEEREISLLDGAEMITNSYDIGEDVLGRKLSVVRLMAVRRDTGMALPIMSGKQALYMIYDPLSHKDIDIQFQHVQGTPDKKEQVQSSAKQTWWPFSWLKAPSEVAAPVYKPGDDDEETLAPNPVSGFISLEEDDLSIPYLKSKFSTVTEILKSGYNCGMVIRIADPGTTPIHELQLSTLYQSDRSAHKHTYAIEIRRKPILNEKKDWKMVTAVKMDLPHTDVEPSDLGDNMYQHEVEQHLQEAGLESVKGVDSLIDMKSKFLYNAIRNVNEQNSRVSLDKSMDDLINHVLENEVDVNMGSLTELVQKQRKTALDIDNLEKQPIHPSRLENYRKSVKSLVQHSKLFTTELVQKLNKVSLGKQKSEEAVLILYMLSSEMISAKKLKSIEQEIHPLLSVNEEVDMHNSLSDLMKELTKLKVMQNHHSLAKQATEMNKALLEINPDERDIHRNLLKLEEDLVSVKVPKITGIDVVKEQKAQLQLQAQLDNMQTQSKTIIDKLDRKLGQKAEIGTMLRMKILEVLLHQQLILFDLENSKVMEIPKSTTKLSTSSVRVSGTLKYDRLKHEVVKTSIKFLNRLIIAVDADTEHTSLVYLTSLKEQDHLKSLQILLLKQLIVLEDLHEIPHLRTEGKPTLLVLQDSVKQVKDVSEKVKEILDTVLIEESYLSPVVIRALKVLSRHLPVIDETILELKKEVMIKVTLKDPDLNKIKQLRSDLRQLKLDVLEHMEGVERSYLTPQSTTTDPLTLTTLLRKTAEVESKQLRLRTIVQKVLEELKHQGSQTPSPEERIKRNQLLFNTIRMASDLQADMELLSDRIYKKIAASPKDESIVGLLNHIEKKQTQYLDLEREVESQVKRLIRSDTSLSQPLQLLQQLKDKAQTHQLKIEDIKTEHQKIVDSSSLPTHPVTNPQPTLKDLHKPLKATIIITYGLVGEKQKTINIQLIGKKSVEQLLWERDQSLPDRQDEHVRRYLQDKRVMNDRVAVGYQHLKDELNTNRHLHLLVSYEDSLPAFVRKYSWTMHEFTKLVFYKKTTLVMPDETNLPNKLDIKLVMKMNNRWVDAEIMTPYETTIFRNLATPAVCTIAAIPRSRPVKEQLIMAVTGTTSLSTCEITKDRIKTLHGTRYEVDQKAMDECEKVLAMDCGLSDKLAVTTKPSQTYPHKKILKIITPSHKVEVTPLKSAVEVTVDDDTVDLTDPPVKDDVAIYKLPDGSVEIRLPHLHMSVVTNGETSSVKASKILSPKLCGLCGDPAAGVGSDLRDPHQVPISEPRPFLSTYIIPDTQCDATTLQNTLEVPLIRKSARNVMPLEKTLVMIQKKHSKTCFSKSPVKSCPSNSKIEGTESVLLHFYCLKSSDPQVPVYTDLAEKHVIDEFRYKPISVSEYVTQPKNCLSQ